MKYLSPRINTGNNEEREIWEFETIDNQSIKHTDIQNISTYGQQNNEMGHKEVRKILIESNLDEI